jgi:hypothetical protein
VNTKAVLNYWILEFFFNWTFLRQRWCASLTSWSLHSATLYLFYVYLRTNSDLCNLHHKLIGFYNRDEKCLQGGTDWVFK